MTFNKLPFSISGTDLDTMESITSAEISYENGRTISEELKELLSKMLEKDPAKRATVQELKNCAFIV